jgi:putative DNA primase/helicase
MGRCKRPTFLRTDAGNAEMFAYESKDDLRYDHSRKRWFVWGGHWWIEDKDGLVYRRALSIARMRGQGLPGARDDEEREEERKWAFQSESRARLDAMVKLAESHHLLTDAGDGWDSDPMLLGVANGVIDLTTGALRDGRQADRITLHMDLNFDPGAKSPRWEQFLREVFRGDEALIGFVQQAVGYNLTGLTSEQCLFLCYGTGANGKSTFLEVLRHIWGGYGYNLPFSAFELKARSAISNDIAAIAGKRLVTALETNESVQLNEARIKALTGCDPITARYLYREYAVFPPTAKLWLAFNHLPDAADDSHGFWRRIRLIPFEQQFSGEQADKDLLAKLKAEAPGILNWALKGLRMYQQTGLSAPPAVVAASDAYRQESDRLEYFFDEQCEIAASAQIAAGVLWTDYLLWARDHEEGRPLSRKAFSGRLAAKGFRKVRRGHDGTWTWLGICLRRSDGGQQHPPGVAPRPADGCGRENPIVVS